MSYPGRVRIEGWIDRHLFKWMTDDNISLRSKMTRFEWVDLYKRYCSWSEKQPEFRDKDLQLKYGTFQRGVTRMRSAENLPNKIVDDGTPFTFLRGMK